MRHCRGRIEGEWDTSLFPPEDSARRRRLFRFDRFLLGGHAALAAVSLYSGHWQPIVLITLGSFYGGWLFFLCNTTQHIGLSDKVADFRLCTRTILLATWREIIAILRRQRVDPDYQFVPELPSPQPS